MPMFSTPSCTYKQCVQRLIRRIINTSGTNKLGKITDIDYESEYLRRVYFTGGNVQGCVRLWNVYENEDKTRIVVEYSVYEDNDG